MKHFSPDVLSVLDKHRITYAVMQHTTRFIASPLFYTDLVTTPTRDSAFQNEPQLAPVCPSALPCIEWMHWDPIVVCTCVQTYSILLFVSYSMLLYFRTESVFSLLCFIPLILQTFAVLCIETHLCTFSPLFNCMLFNPYIVNLLWCSSHRGHVKLSSKQHIYL